MEEPTKAEPSKEALAAEAAAKLAKKKADEAAKIKI
jgi:hypothetical protein